MTPPLLCKCGHPRGLHDIGSGLEPCRRRACGCSEFRLDARSRTGSDDSAAEGDAA